MPPSRREFLHTAAAAPLGAALAPLPARPQATASLDRWRQRSAATNYEPWLEIDAVALRHNVREIARLAGGRPVLAVVKNNAYGLGLARVGPVIDALAPVGALAVVKPEEALALRAAGVRKPILLMGLADVETGIELASHDIQLSVFTDDASERLDLNDVIDAVPGEQRLHPSRDPERGRQINVLGVAERLRFDPRHLRTIPIRRRSSARRIGGGRRGHRCASCPAEASSVSAGRPADRCIRTS